MHKDAIIFELSIAYEGEKVQLALKQNDVVALEANPRGCSRSSAAKIDRHGPVFKVLRVRRNHQPMHGVPAIKVKSETTQWEGWLPSDHVAIKVLAETV